VEEVKLLVTKRKEITDEEDDQDVVIETLRNIQAIVEYWIQDEHIKGVKNIMNEKVLKDVRCYSD